LRGDRNIQQIGADLIGLNVLQDPWRYLITYARLASFTRLEHFYFDASMRG
jgi:hypothetical protein